MDDAGRIAESGIVDGQYLALLYDADGTLLWDAETMGVSFTDGDRKLVLTSSNVVVSGIRHWVRPELRIPVFVMVIASLVTVVDLSMKAWFYDLHKILGIFIPLIVTNCVIIARAEAFASKNNVARSFTDGLMMGLGFTLVLVTLGAVPGGAGRGEGNTRCGYPVCQCQPDVW